MMDDQNITLLPEDVPGATLRRGVSLHDHGVQELKRWLECRGLKKKGKKSKLIERIKNCIDAGRENSIFLGVDGGLWYEKKKHADQASSSSGSTSAEPSTKPSTQTVGKWNKFPSVNIPKFFNRGHIYSYIVGTLIEDEDCEVTYESTTEKPFRRGKQYVDSDYIHDVMDKLVGNSYMLKANCYSSFQKNEKYSVNIELNNLSGAVISGQCECKASALGRCSHVSAVLLFLEKHCIAEGHSALAPTSKLREWGLGAKDKDPGSVAVKEYKNVKIPSFRSSFDPRSTGYTREINLNNFVADLQKNEEQCIFQSFLTIEYEDFVLDEEDINILKTKVLQFRENMKTFFNTQLSLNSLVLIKGTDQGSKKWKKMRRYFLTSSLTKRITSLTSDSAKMNFFKKHLWGLSKDIQTNAMRYGSEMESVARTSYILRVIEEGEEVQQIGLVVNKKYPFLASSVDGIVMKNGQIVRIIEIKCPKLLEGHDPHDFQKILTPAQRNNFFLRKVNGVFGIKDNHPYLYQVVTSMIVFEVDQCDFVVWSDKNMLVFKVHMNEIDQVTINNIESKLKNFYYNCYVPEMFLMKTPRNLKCEEINFSS